MSADKFIRRVVTKFTTEQMRTAFANVSNPTDWKLPVNRVITNPGSKNVECLARAILEFTGTEPTIILLSDNKLHVQAAGYYDMEAACNFSN